MRQYCVYNMRNKLYSGFDNIEDSKSVIIKYFMIYCINFGCIRIDPIASLNQRLDFSFCFVEKRFIYIS